MASYFDNMIAGRKLGTVSALALLLALGADGHAGESRLQAGAGAQASADVAADFRSGARGESRSRADADARGDARVQGEADARGDASVRGEADAQGDAGVRGEAEGRGEGETRGESDADGETGTGITLPVATDGLEKLALPRVDGDAAARAAGRVIATLGTSADSLEPVPGDTPAMPDAPEHAAPDASGSLELVTTTAGRASAVLESQGDPELPGLPDGSAAAEVAGEATGQLGSTVDAGGADTVATMTGAAGVAAETGAALSAEAVDAARAAVAADVASELSAEVASEVRDAVSTDVVADITRSLPLPGQ